MTSTKGDQAQCQCTLFLKTIVISLLLTCDERWHDTFHMKPVRQQQFAHYNSLKCEKFAYDGFLYNSEKHHKNHMGVALNYLTQQEDGIDLLEQIISSDESWIQFYNPKRKSPSMVWKKKRKKYQESSRMEVCQAGNVNSFLRLPWLSVH